MAKAPAHGRSKKKSVRNKRFLIFCGAEVTEIEYFDYVKSVVNRHCAMGWEVQEDIEVEGEGVDPLTLTEGAIDLLRADARTAKKEHYEPFDQVWAVTDVDDFGEKIMQAQRKADSTSGKVRLVISNPCFEVWIIDHIRSCPESYKETPTCQELAKQLGLIDPSKGHKNKHLVIDRIAGQYSAALENAARHMRDSEQQSLRIRHPSVSKKSNYAPWTDVPAITKTIITECHRVSGNDITDEL